MRLVAALTKDRQAEGQFWVEGDDGVVFGPVRCRGEADSGNAAKFKNILEDPTRVAGDHPFGVCRVVDIVTIQPADTKGGRTYGPFFVRLHPVSGEAWTARQQGREGIGLHGGDLGPAGELRATFGCLRLDNASLVQVVDRLFAERAAGREVFYECREGGPACSSPPSF